MGFFLVNDLQDDLPSKRADGKIFLTYVSDNFKMKKKKKMKKMKEKNEI